ncbi:hypothetical protein ACFE04_012011 [Oxalis oulophora]
MASTKPNPSSSDSSPSSIKTVNQITNLYKSLPQRSSIQQIEAALSVIQTVNTEEQTKLEAIDKETNNPDGDDVIFSVLKEFKKKMVIFQSYEQRKEALYLVEVDKMLEGFDLLIRKLNIYVSGADADDAKVEVFISDPVERIGEKSVSDDGVVKDFVQTMPAFLGILNWILITVLLICYFSPVREFLYSTETAHKVPVFFSFIISVDVFAHFIGEENAGKLSMMNIAVAIENSAKTGDVVLNLRGKLMDQVEWLPVSIGKLSNVTELDLSENRIMALPTSIGSLKALLKLDLHSNQLINLPECFGELTNLIYLDLHANQLKSLPNSFGDLINLVNLDLSSNNFVYLPEIIGMLSALKILNAETNELEELPYMIGNCSSLVELRLDFNRLKALPEAVGKLQCLEILTLHYNKIKGLPTTMGNLLNLLELDVSFNELESVPENLCFAINLKKLNVANNFADLRALPRSIGNLEMLEELDISDDQIRELPDSFRLLSRLRVFRADETPLEVPPKQVAKLGAQAVVQYMDDFVMNRDAKFLQQKTTTIFWSRICSFCWPFTSTTN